MEPTTILVIIMCVVFLHGQSDAQGDSSEPTCSSRFDYDFKMMKTLVDVNKAMSDLQETVRYQASTIQQLERGLYEKTSELTALDGAVRRLQENGLGGSTYVRWGRTTCSGNGTELIYSGYAGGSFFNQKGGAVDYMCLPKEPEWGHYDDGKNAGAHMYGAEYQFNDLLRFFASVGLPNLQQNDVPCDVCRTKRSSVVMIPAKKNCHSGWTREYHGYLNAGAVVDDAASQFVCLDGVPEVVTGGIANKNGKVFYLVEARCGSLPCPPYVDGRELTCVVCSK